MQEDYQLLSIDSPVYFLDETVCEVEECFVKGFASVEAIDRSGDIVSPEEFNIERFMAAPALLVNHTLWIDENGNGVAVGRLLSAHVAKIVESNDAEYWDIKDIKTGEIIDKFPKSRIPDLVEGDRGLFVKAKVTRREVADMVRRGELSAFSWRGRAKVSYKISEDGTAKRHLTDIDLWEISLVNIPDNPHATFILGKNIQGYQFSKLVFNSKSSVQDHLTFHGIEAEEDSIHEDDSCYYYGIDEQTCLNDNKLCFVKMANGVSAIVGNKKVEKCQRSPLQWVELALGKDLVNVLSYRFQSIFKSGVSKMAEETTQISENSLETKEVQKGDCGPGTVYDEEHGKCVESKEAQALEALGEAISKKVSDAVLGGMKPLFESVTSSMKTVSDSLGQIAAKMAEINSPKPSSQEDNKFGKEEVEKKVDESKPDMQNGNEMNKFLKSLTDSLAAQASKLEEVSKAVAALGSITSLITDREEKIVPEKKPDPNAVFDTTFPFFRN